MKNEQLALRRHPEEHNCFVQRLDVLFCGLSVGYLVVFCVHSHLFLSACSDKAKVSNSRVIVHCLAGISRSATIAIAYIMKTMGLSSDDAYR